MVLFVLRILIVGANFPLSFPPSLYHFTPRGRKCTIAFRILIVGANFSLSFPPSLYHFTPRGRKMHDSLSVYNRMYRHLKTRGGRTSPRATDEMTHLDIM